MHLLIKTSQTCHQSIQFFYFLSISIKEREEAGLGTGGPLHSSELQVTLGPADVPHVHAEVRQPEASSFADRGQLCWSSEGNMEENKIHIRVRQQAMSLYN